MKLIEIWSEDSLRGLNFKEHTYNSVKQGFLKAMVLESSAFIYSLVQYYS